MTTAVKSKPAPEVFKEKTIYGKRLLIWRNALRLTPKARHLWAILPSEEFNGKETQLHDWKANIEEGKTKGTIYVRGAIYHGCGHWQQFENTFPCETEEIPLPKPGRNFEWDEFNGEWRNSKTGKRVRIV